VRVDGRVAPFTFSDFPYHSLSDVRRRFVAYQTDDHVARGRTNEQLLTCPFDVNSNVAWLTAHGAEFAVDAVAAKVLRVHGGYPLTLPRIAESTSPGNPVGYPVRRQTVCGGLRLSW
jgi:hypothetical protein